MSNKVSILLLLGLSAPGWAQPAPSPSPESATNTTSVTPEYDLEETVVTADKAKTRRKDTTATVEVVKREDLKRINARNFDDVLRLLPGLIVNRPAGLGIVTPQSINIRGVQGPDRVLLLVDGMRVNNGANDFINLNTLSVDSIERIEVVKGGNSALYGTNALGGVINIITRSGSDLKPGEQAFRTRLETGNFGYRRISVGADAADDSVRLSVGYENQATNNVNFRDSMLDALTLTDNSTDGEEIGRTGSGVSDVKQVRRSAYNIGFNSDRYRLRLNADVGEGQTLDFSLNASDNRTGVKDSRNINTLSNFPTTPQPRLVIPPNVIQDANITTRQFQFGVNYQNQLNEDWLLTARYALTDSSQDFYDEAFSGVIPYRLSVPPPRGITVNLPAFAPSQRSTQSKVHNGEVRVAGKSGDHRIVAGVEYIGKVARWSNVNRDNGFNIFDAPRSASDSNFGFYAQDVWSLSSATDLSLGLRFDNNSLYGSAFSPKVGLLHRFDDSLRLRANFSRSFRAPALNQGFEIDFPFAPFSVFRSNPNLKPEFVTSYEVGVEKDFTQDVTGTLTLFRNDQTNLITTTVAQLEPRQGFTLGVRRYDNLSAVTAQGAELGLRARWSDQWSTQLSYTYLDAYLSQDGPFDATTGGPTFRSGDRLEGAAQHNGALTMAYQSTPDVGGIGCAVTARLKSNTREQNFALRRVQNVPGYAVFDINLDYKAFENGRIFATVYNVLDHRYQEQTTDLAPGRQIFGGLNLEF